MVITILLQPLNGHSVVAGRTDVPCRGTGCVHWSARL